MKKFGCSMQKKKESLQKRSSIREGMDDCWDDWKKIYGLASTLENIRELTYELKNCIRGSYTGRKTWIDLADYLKDLAKDLDDAANEMATMPEPVDEPEDDDADD